MKDLTTLSPQRHRDTVDNKNLISVTCLLRIFYFLCVTASLWLISCAGVWADQLGGQRPDAYLGLGAGGTPNSMGGAAAAQRGDVSAGFWNPAGLTGIRGIQVEDQYSLLSLNQQLNYFGLALERRQQLFFSGAFLIYSAGGDLEARQGPSLNPDSIFGDTEMTFLLSVAGKLDRQWSMGINLKGFFNQLGAVSGTGFGGDWGVQYRISNETTFGFAVQDVYSSIGYSNSSTATEVFPATLRTGIADQDVKTHVKGELDMEWSNDVGWKPRAGIEWRPMEVIALRGGFWYEINTGSNNFSAGIGLLLPGAESLGEFDYTLLGDRLVPGGVLHQFSLKGKFL